MDNLHQLAQQRAAQVETVGETQSGFDQILNAVAKADTYVQSSDTIKTTEDWLLWWWSFQSLGLGLAALRGVSRKSIPPEQLWEELHSRGVTGKGLTVGVVDDGWMPTKALPEERVRFFEPGADEPSKYRAAGGHGTQVSDIIARALPDAKFVVVPYIGESKKGDQKESEAAGLSERLTDGSLNLVQDTFEGFIQAFLPNAGSDVTTPARKKDAETASIEKQVKAFLKEGLKDPGKLNLVDLRKIYQPLITNIANGVTKAIDEGADVVNVSLSVEQAVQLNIAMALILARVALTGMLLKSLVLGLTPEQKAKGQKLMKFEEKLKALGQSNVTSNKVDAELLELYKPWIAALDYAKSKNVPIVLAAGNDGNHNAKNPFTIGKLNLLSLINHPALISVASANSNGELCEFTSEWNDEIQPHNAANGSGELDAQPKALKRQGLISFLLNPFAKLEHWIKNGNPRGTSFAAPDEAGTVGQMMAGALAVGKAKPSIAEIKSTLARTSTPAKLSPKALRAVQQHAKDEKVELTPEMLAGEIKRRTKNGILNRLKAVIAISEK